MLLNSPDVQIGWQAVDFELKDPDGVAHRMSDYLGDKGLLITFICNHCPYVQAVADRLAEDAKTLKAEGINTLAVMSNDYRLNAYDSPENMKRFAAHFGFDFPYIIDTDQSVAQTYGAVCTPEFLGLNGQGQLQYRGRIDDQGRVATGERNAELVEAMRLIARTGSGPALQHASMGCSIKWTNH